MDKPLEHVVIIGCGLLGASLGLALRKRGLAKLITGVGRRGSASVEVAQQRGAIDRATDDPAAAVRDAEVVVVCTPVRQFPEMFRTIAPHLAKDAVVTDVGSTKADVMAWAADILPGKFVGSHPMAGSEKSGPEAAREDLYQGAVCLICEAQLSDWVGNKKISRMWQGVGMRLLACGPQQHDQWVAAVSHLPHAVSASLMQAAGNDLTALSIAAGGFVDSTRIAAGDPTMWTDIFLTNRIAVAELIGRFTETLTQLKAAIERGDEPAIHSFLTAAKQQRDAFMAKRGK